jgi:hypothetical protein
MKCLEILCSEYCNACPYIIDQHKHVEEESSFIKSDLFFFNLSEMKFCVDVLN